MRNTKNYDPLVDFLEVLSKHRWLQDITYTITNNSEDCYTEQTI